MSSREPSRQRHYHADKKYKEAVAEAVEACADDTKGQTCYICTYATALFLADSATLDDLREAKTSLEETKRTAQRVLGGAYPLVVAIEQALGAARTALRARETPPTRSS